MNERPAPRPWLDAVGLVLLKAVVTGGVLSSGFRAVSDDDYARVALAERFADAPSVDPTGTSWLPFPFYLYGAALRVFGNSLGNATAIAALLGAVSALLCWIAARLLGLGRGAAFLAALLCAVLPYSAYLGAAAVPEAPVAGIGVFAAATLTRRAVVRLLGAGSLFVACASRYEPWAVAAIFALFTGFDAVKTRERSLFAAAAVAGAFPLLWLLHGIVRHGDATFFVSRVAAYRAALGSDDTLLARCLRTPTALVLGEPELCFGFCGLALSAFWLNRPSANEARNLARFGLPLLGVMLLSFAGDVRGSAPTHHAGRALLAVWFAMAILAALLIERAFAMPKKNLAAVLVGAAALALPASLLRWRWPREPFANRAEAIDIGAHARASVGRLAIDTDDFAFFAIQAAFGHPAQTVVLDEHDPRKPRTPSWTADPHLLLKTLRNAGCSALTVPRSRELFAHAIGRVSEENAGYLLVELADP